MALTILGKRVASGEVKPKNHVDWEFRKAIALELVFAWQDATNEVRDSLERVMFNVGIVKLEDSGEWSIEGDNGTSLRLGSY